MVDDWRIEESGFHRERANYYETLFTVGNGRLGTRGSLEEGHLGDLPGTFLAGVYDNHDVAITDLVNALDWVDTAVFVDGIRLDVDTCTVVSHDRVLDLRTGLLSRTTVFEDAQGRRTRLETLRCASIADRRICGLRVEVTPENHSASITVETGIDGDRRNLERLPQYPEGTVFPPQTRWEKWARARHLDETDRSDADEFLYLQMRTIAGGVGLGHAAAIAFDPPPDSRTVRQRRERITEVTTHTGAPGRTLRMDKLVAICTSRDVDAPASGALRGRCLEALDAHRDGFDAVVEASRAAWERLWEDCDCEVVGHPGYTLALRLGMYHLLIAANPDDPTVSIGAKSLSGEGYRGHVFWDTEIFILPFFILTCPDAARALLGYRHHTLDGARTNSREHGTPGARYAWESADTGREECPIFTPDGSGRFWTREEEIHVSADVAYGLVRYVEATGDTAFLTEIGAEILFETSRFWVGRVQPNADGDGYELRQVMGPDEFHSHIDNNAFTNRLAQWHLEHAVALHDRLREEDPEALAAVAARIGLQEAERDRWDEVGRMIVGPRVRDDGVIEQFTGYFERHDVPVTEWDANDMPRYPAGYHHFNCEPTTLLKQPDVVMLMYLLPDEFDHETKKANFEFYEARTLHKSSLSPCIHAIMGMQVGDTAGAVQYFERSAFVDLHDNQGNTAEGMHIASAAGTWQILVSGFGGLRTSGGQLTFNPWLPTDWQGIRFRLHWRGRPLSVAIDHDQVELRLGGEPGAAEEVMVHGKPIQLTAGETARVPYR